MYRKDKRIKQKMVVLGAFILGILISIYTKTLNPNKVYITLEKKKEIESEIEHSKKEIEKLKALLHKNEISLNEYKKALNNENKSVKNLMKDELDYMKVISGNSEVIGPGILITIEDSEKELVDGQNPNDLIVHDIDILRLLNDLKKSGAEAISINGERVLPTSEIKCSGATITVNETTYGQPFIIRAIGEVDILSAAMISPESYASLLKDVYGIYIKVQEKNDIIINSYEKSK